MKTTKPRRTKAQIALDKRIEEACQNACNGKSINIFRLKDITQAAKAAAEVGGDIEAAAEAKAAELNEAN